MTQGTFEDDLVHAWLACLADNAWCGLNFESPSLGAQGRGEISGGGYRRYQLTFSTPASRTIWTLKPAKWTGLIANRLTHFSIWNAKNKGKLRAYGPIGDDGVLVATGSGFVINAGLIALSIE